VTAPDGVGHLAGRSANLSQASAEAASGVPGSPSQRFWLLVTQYATTIADWATAESAAGKVLDNSPPMNQYLHVHYRVRALHELGRDEDALEVLEGAFEAAMFAEGPELRKAIPTNIGEAFAAKCLAVATKVEP
jgi:hypothetical protein